MCADARLSAHVRHALEDLRGSAGGIRLCSFDFRLVEHVDSARDQRGDYRRRQVAEITLLHLAYELPTRRQLDERVAGGRVHENIEVSDCRGGLVVGLGALGGRDTGATEKDDESKGEGGDLHDERPHYRYGFSEAV